MASDIKINFDTDLMEFDIKFINGDVEREEGLLTSVLISIFTNRRAENDDNLINESDKQGWWGDLISNVDDDKIGSRLWLLDRSKTDQQTLLDAKFYIEESLQWMIDDEVASFVNVTTERIDRNDGSATLGATIQISYSDGNTIAFKFVDLWNAQLEV